MKKLGLLASLPVVAQEVVADSHQAVGYGYVFLDIVPPPPTPLQAITGAVTGAISGNPELFSVIGVISVIGIVLLLRLLLARRIQQRNATVSSSKKISRAQKRVVAEN